MCHKSIRTWVQISGTYVKARHIIPVYTSNFGGREQRQLGPWNSLAQLVSSVPNERPCHKRQVKSNSGRLQTSACGLHTHVYAYPHAHMYTCKDMQYMNTYKTNKIPLFICLAPACFSSDTFANLGCVYSQALSAPGIWCWTSLGTLPIRPQCLCTNIPPIFCLLQRLRKTFCLLESLPQLPRFWHLGFW